MTHERVQRTYLTLVLLQTLAASLIWGVNTLFLLDAGLKTSTPGDSKSDRSLSALR